MPTTTKQDKLYCFVRPAFHGRESTRAKEIEAANVAVQQARLPIDGSLTTIKRNVEVLGSEREREKTEHYASGITLLENPHDSSLTIVMID